MINRSGRLRNSAGKLIENVGSKLGLTKKQMKGRKGSRLEDKIEIVTSRMLYVLYGYSGDNPQAVGYNLDNIRKNDRTILAGLLRIAQIARMPLADRMAAPIGYDIAGYIGAKLLRRVKEEVRYRISEGHEIPALPMHDIYVPKAAQTIPNT